MKYIAVIAVIGILLLQLTGAIPLSSVGGAMTIALAFFAAALGCCDPRGMDEETGVLGWIVNIVVSFVGAFLAAPSAALLWYRYSRSKGRWRPREVPWRLSRSPA